MGFWNALSVLAPVAPALDAAAQLRIERQQQQDQFAQEQKLRDAQLVTQQLANQAEKQKLAQPVTYGDPQWNPLTHSNQVLTFDPQSGGFALKDVPGVDPAAAAAARYQSARSEYKQATGRDLTPAEDQSLFFQSYGLKTPAELTPFQSLQFNQPKLSMTGNVPVVSYQGKDFTEADLKSPDTPKEVSALLQSAVDEQKQKEADADKRQQDALDRQTRAFAQANAMQTQRVIDALHTNDYEKAQAEVRKAQNSFDLSRNLAYRMDLAAQALQRNPADQQAMFSILSNHIVMTTRQPGSSMRPSKPLFDEAVSSLPAADNLMKRFDENHGLLQGIVLTPDQVRQMVDLAHERVQSDQQTLGQVKQDYAEALGWGQGMEQGTSGRSGTNSARGKSGKSGKGTSAPPAAPTASGFDWNSAPIHAPGGPQ